MSQSPYSSSTQVASSVPFDNSTDGFVATDVQTAIEEARTITQQEATATADTTTTSTTDVLVTGMTLTPASGTYIVFFSAGVDHSNQSVAVVVSLYSGGVQKASSVRSPIPRFNGVGAITLTPIVAINGTVVVNGSQAIEIRWKTASGTATMHQRILNILKVL